MDTLDIVKKYGKNEEILQLCCKIDSDRCRYLSIESALTILSIRKNNFEMIKLLIKWGYDVDFPISDNVFNKIKEDNDRNKEKTDMLLEKLNFIVSRLN